MDANEFTPIKGKPNNYLHPDGVSIYVTREGQSLQEFLDEMEASNPERVDLHAYLAAQRYDYEQGGCVWNGWQVPTDDRSQLKYTSEMMAVQSGARLDGDYWKFPHGFEALSNQQVVEMATAVRAWVLSCFDAEAKVGMGIAQGSITTPEQVDAELAKLLSELQEIPGE